MLYLLAFFPTFETVKQRVYRLILNKLYNLNIFPCF